MFLLPRFILIFISFNLVVLLKAQDALYSFSKTILKGEAYIDLGDSLRAKKQYKASNHEYQKAIKIFQEKNQWEKVISTALVMNENYFRNRTFQKSAILLEKYLKLIPEGIENRDSLRALMIHKIGGIYYKEKNYQKAIEKYEEALSIRRNIFNPNHPDIIKGLHNIGQGHKSKGNSDLAIYYLEKSIQEHPIKPYSFIATTYRILSELFADIGQYSKAETYLQLSLAMNLGKYEKQPWMIAESHHLVLTAFFLKSKQYDMAINSCNNAIEIYNSIEDKYPDDFINMAKCYNNVGLANLYLKNYEEALTYFLKAENIVISKLKNSKKVLLGKINENIGIGFKHLKKFDESEKRFLKSLSIKQKLNLDLDIADTHNNLGDLYFVQNKYQKALKHYHLSLPFLLKDFKEENVYQNPVLKDHYIPDKKGLLVFLEAKAKTFKTLYDQNPNKKDLAAAHQTYQLLDELIDDIRLSYLEDASKSYLVKQAKPIYEKAIGLCLQYHQFSGEEKYLAEAFKYAEKSKAIILLEQIKEAKANTFAGIPDSLQQKERNLKKEIGQLEKQLALQKEEETTDSLGKSARAQLIHAKTKYEDLIKRFEKENSEYHQLKYDLQTADIPTIQTNLLKDSQLLVEYFVGADSIYIFKVSPTDFEVMTKAKDFPLKEWVDGLRQGIYYCRVNKEATAEDCARLDKQYSDYGAKLYQQLVSPLALRAATKDLIIIPDGVLGYIPFDALLTKDITTDQQNQFQTYPYFGLHYTICYGFSATFLKELQQTNTQAANNQLLAFAPSFQLKKIEQESTVEEEIDPVYAQRSSLSPLFFNEAEVNQIAKAFGGVAYNNSQANKTKFIQEVTQYRYLHIASHGKMNEENADLSYISFTQNGDSTNQEELLYLRELYDLDIPADMVVLSACETGIGELQNGEGIISLARGFSYAGAKSIITSLWNVNDQKTADLMVDFYENLNKGQSKDAALANAKRAYIQQNTATFSHPFYWAGFVPIGNMKPIEARTIWSWALGIGLGSLLIGLGAGFYWKSRLLVKG